MNGDAEFQTPSLQAQITCAECEVAKRQSVYPRLIAAGRLGQQKADYEILTMETIVETLRNLEAAPKLWTNKFELKTKKFEDMTEREHIGQ